MLSIGNQLLGVLELEPSSLIIYTFSSLILIYLLDNCLGHSTFKVKDAVRVKRLVNAIVGH